MSRGGTWLLPFHGMDPLLRSPAADTHGCIMVVGLSAPIQGCGAIVAPVAWLRSGLEIIDLRLKGGLRMLRLKARASRLRP